MIDRSEATRQGWKKKKPASAHPYAAIEHRVIDSAAFADLKPNSVKILLLMARQVTLRNGLLNNGHLQATFSYLNRYGIGSEHTVQAAIQDLIAHGFIYKTRSHGANKAWARYALTWLPIHNKQDLFLGGWVPYSWRNWTPNQEKTPRKNCRINPAKFAVSAVDFLQKLQDDALQKLQTMNSMPCKEPKAMQLLQWINKQPRHFDHSRSPYPRSICKRHRWYDTA